MENFFVFLGACEFSLRKVFLLRSLYYSHARNNGVSIFSYETKYVIILKEESQCEQKKIPKIKPDKYESEKKYPTHAVLITKLAKNKQGFARSGEFADIARKRKTSVIYAVVNFSRIILNLNNDYYYRPEIIAADEM